MSHAATDLPRRHRLTVADYYRMAEIGILAPEARVELIDGEIIDMAPPGSAHAGTVTYLTQVLVRAVAEIAIVLAQNPVRLRLVDLGGRRLVRFRAPQHGSYALVDEPALDVALEVSALAGVTVDLDRLYG
jgi:hypothetical protein